MAEEVVDLVLRRRDDPRRSVTARTPLLDGDLGELRHAVAERVEALGLDPAVAESLVLSYGDRASEVLDLAEEEDRVAPLVPGLPYLQAELVWGAREEMAATAGDLLARRTRVSLEDPYGGLTDPELLAGLLASALQVPSDEAAQQLATYREALTHERGPSVPVQQPPLGGAAASVHQHPE
jgi:glycerol-3-phosphate dehydrogenase